MTKVLRFRIYFYLWLRETDIQTMWTVGGSPFTQRCDESHPKDGTSMGENMSGKIFPHIPNGSTTQRRNSQSSLLLSYKDRMNRGSPFTWEKISKSKFGLTSRMVQQPNGGTREVPCYSLTKTAWTGVPRSHEAVKSCKVANCMRFSDWGAGDDRVICSLFLPFFFAFSKCLFIFAIGIE